ncbi:GyrI-like domain-containing protein [Spirillospora sp. CA-294931]|uniref:GyrI-like domain-containing protein n=1 Tax=Spirillospora sp. CA-294931 TaxID=3240042 RepID=UPI003D8F0B6E
MSSQPRIEERPAQAYASMHRKVTMATIAEIADRIPELVGWVLSRGIPMAGAPFLKYDLIAMDGVLEVEAGLPIGGPAEGDDQVRVASLPAGRYASLTHVGHPDELVGRTAELLEWAEKSGLSWDADDTGRWACRMEVYKTNPAEEPDPARWETELVFKLADAPPS